MTEFLRLNPDTDELIALNQCRIYLKAYHVSDIASASGKKLSFHAWEGTHRQQGTTNNFNWPYQGKPSKASWDTWRKFTRRALLTRGMNLKHDLGDWYRYDWEQWIWYYSPTLDGLLQHLTPDIFLLHQRNHSKLNQRLYSSSSKLLHSLPATLLKASVRQTRNHQWWLIDTGQVLFPAPNTSPSTFAEYLSLSRQTNSWCFDHFSLPSNYEEILPEITTGDILLVSDGSYHPTKHQGTAAWILKGTKSSIQIIGRVVTPGHDTTQSTYRSELAGILATITVLNTLLSFHKITSTLTLRCDCETGLRKAFDLSHKPTLQDSCYDLLQAIHYELSHTNITWQSMHIKGHMDQRHC
jgi:hypothetical protein